jgi:multidrug efflux system membrane fusion protein
VPVVTVAVSRRDVPIYLDGLGTVQAFNTVTVRSQVDGELIEVLFREGQDVKAGDVLAQIDPRTYRAAYEQAQATRDKDQAQLDAAKRDLARYIGLGDRVTGQSVDTQRAQVRQFEAAVRADEAAVSSARVQLSHTVIAAPIDGRTGMRLVDRGNIVHSSDSTGLVTLTQVQPIAVVFTLPQQTLTAISTQMAQGARLKVLATQSDGKGVIDTGELELIDNLIDQTTGTIKLKAVLPNAERKLWPGGFVTVRLLLDVRRAGLVVPVTAIQRGPQGPYVFRVNPDRTAEMRPVTIGAIESEMALIESGLEENEQVVTDGVAKLKPGARISLPEDRAARAAKAAASSSDSSHPAREKNQSTSAPIPPPASAPAPAGERAP